MSSSAEDLHKQWIAEREKEKATIKELQKKAAERKENLAKMETRQNGMVVEASPNHDNKRIIANQYVQYYPKKNQHEVVDWEEAAPHIKTIRSIGTTLEKIVEEQHGRDWVEVEKPTYVVITEPNGETLKWTPDLHGTWNVPYWFIIEPEPSSTSTSTSTAGGRRRYRKKRTKRRTRGKKRGRSKRKSRGKRRRRKRSRKRRR